MFSDHTLTVIVIELCVYFNSQIIKLPEINVWLYMYFVVESLLSKLFKDLHVPHDIINYGEGHTV